MTVYIQTSPTDEQQTAKLALDSFIERMEGAEGFGGDLPPEIQAQLVQVQATLAVAAEIAVLREILRCVSGNVALLHSTPTTS